MISICVWAQDEKPIILPMPEPILPGEPYPGIPTPGAPFFEPKFTVSPENPSAEDLISVQVEGFLPDTSHSITGGSSVIENNLILLHLRVESSGSGLTVLEPSDFQFEIGTLSDGVYATELLVNGITAGYFRFQVGQGEITDPKPEPIPLPNPDYGPYRAYISVDPAYPAPGEKFSLYLSGAFPTSGYQFGSKRFVVDGNIIWVNAEIIVPEGPVMQVVSPFHEEVGTLALPEGGYEIFPVINGLTGNPTYIYIGAQVMPPQYEVLLRYQREGGFAGTSSWLEIMQNKTFRRYNDFRKDAGVEEGIVPEDIWMDLFTTLKDGNFEDLPDIVKPDFETADGFVYTISYSDKKVIAHDGADFPVVLSHSLQILNTLLDTAPIERQYSYTEDTASSVPHWEAY
ncbi:MAG: hypothetical protein ACOX5R_00710 [bacterium]